MSAKLTLKDGKDPFDFWSTNAVYGTFQQLHKIFLLSQPLLLQ